MYIVQACVAVYVNCTVCILPHTRVSNLLSISPRILSFRKLLRNYKHDSCCKNFVFLFIFELTFWQSVKSADGLSTCNSAEQGCGSAYFKGTVA